MSLSSLKSRLYSWIQTTSIRTINSHEITEVIAFDCRYENNSGKTSLYDEYQKSRFAGKTLIKKSKKHSKC